MSTALAAFAAVAFGALAGALGPWLVRTLPEPELDPDEPAKVPYADLAAPRGLGVRLAILTALVCGILGLARGAAPDLPAFLLLGWLGTVMCWVDVQVHRLPNRFTGAAFGAGALALAVAALSEGDWGQYGRAWLGALVLCGFYFLLAFIRPSDMGFGDVKLAGVLGLYLGWLGWGEVATGAFFGFLLGGLGGIVLIVARRAGLRSAIPFGPYMMAGALVAIVWGRAVVDFYWGSV